MALQADSGEIGRFVRALFVYAESNTCASLRAFHQTNSKAPSEFIRPVHINGSLGPLIDEATEWATRAAGRDHPVVFCPPICTFLAGQRGRNEDLANGLTLSVEIDQGDTQAARRLLEGLLGVATAVVSSGGEWTNPETGEIHAKLHLHWRLSEPTRDIADHERLRLARDMAGRLAGADPTGKPIVHPLRWPGSWNQKGANPVMARIVQLNESAEINLIEALDALADAVEASGMAAADLPRSSDPTAPLPLLATAMAAIPNHDEHYDTWIRYGYAAFRAAGSDEGRALWETWSRKSAKFDAGEQDAAWSRIHKAILGSSAPRTIGAGTIFFDAARHGWSRPAPEAPDDPPGYWDSIDSEAQSAAAPHHVEDAGDEDEIEFPATTVGRAEFDNIAPREWVYSHFLIRKFISVLGAPGGVGKTAYAYPIALAVVSGSELLREKLHETGAVWIYNLEDPRAELLRRLKAAMWHYNIDFSEIEGRLFLDSGRDRPLVIAKATRDGGMIASPIVPAIIAEIQRRKIRLLIVDPFVRSHRLEENVNEQIDFAAALWGQVADKGNCSVLLLHHFRKGAVGGDAASFRGASALVDAARAAISLSPMSEDEAGKLGVQPDDRWRFVRADNAKLNLAPPPERTIWLKLVGVDLENATNDHESDKVQTVERWDPPSPWADMGVSVVVRILDRIQAGPEEGEQFTLTRGGKSARWAGAVVMELAQKTDKQAATILRAWVANQVLLSGRYHSPSQRKERDGVQVDPSKLAEIRKTGAPLPPDDEP